MDDFTILLLGAFIGLILGIMLLKQRVDVHVDRAYGEPQDGCLAPILFLLIAVGVLAMLSIGQRP